MNLGNRYREILRLGSISLAFTNADVGTKYKIQASMKDEKSIVFIWQCFPQDLIWDYTMHQDQFERNVFEYYCGWVALALHLLMLMLHKQIYIYNCILNIIISATLDNVS